MISLRSCSAFSRCVYEYHQFLRVIQLHRPPRTAPSPHLGLAAASVAASSTPCGKVGWTQGRLRRRFILPARELQSLCANLKLSIFRHPHEDCLSDRESTDESVRIKL